MCTMFSVGMAWRSLGFRRFWVIFFVAAEQERERERSLHFMLGGLDAGDGIALCIKMGRRHVSDDML